jgi:hypothetical protein
MTDNTPVKKFRLGAVEACVWKNGEAMSVTLTKSYKDNDGVWKNTPTMFVGDVTHAIRVLRRAEEYLLK